MNNIFLINISLFIYYNKFFLYVTGILVFKVVQTMLLEIEVVGKGKVEAELDKRNPKTAREIYKALPIEGNANVWLEEVYFQISQNLDYETPSSKASRGDLSYWPPGAAFCIFYGESQPASDVNHIGRITGNLALFENVVDSDKIIIREL